MQHDTHDEAIVAMLGTVGPGPPASFTDDVMRRVARAPRLTPVRRVIGDAAAPEGSDLPWWARSLVQPATIGAFVATSLVAGWPREIVREVAAVSTDLATTFTVHAMALPSWGALLAGSIVVTLVFTFAVAGAAARTLPTR